GVAGLYDPALDWFDMEVQDEDFGQAFAVWGIGAGPVLHLPVLGQSNLRDGIGKIFDYAFDPKTYVPYPGVFGFTVLNESAHRYRDMDTFYRANYDPYELLKRLYASERFFKINDYDRSERFMQYQKKLSSEVQELLPAETDPLLNEVVISGFESQGAHVDTLRVVMVSIQNENKSMWVDVSLWNTDFFNQGSIRSIEVIKGKPDMPYKVWYQKQNDAPIAVVIPGFGSHFTGTHISAVSEILFNQGYTVVALNNAFNWEFMSTAASVPVPGYIPSDAEDVRGAIAAVFKDLENKGLCFRKKILVGYSLGGMHALFIGAKEKAEPKLKIDQFVAINPPVDAVKAVSALDGIGHAWKKWPREQVFERGSFAACKYIAMSRKHYKPYGELETENAKYEPLPFSDIEAQALISFNYKITLDEMILSIVRNNGDMNCFKSPCSWGNRTDFYREINQLSFADYHKMFLLKYRSDMEKRTLSADELNERSSLASIEDFLRNAQNVFIIHSSNDFLESPAERHLLRKIMGDRCVFYNVGGHLGNLYLAGLQSKLASLACNLKKQANSPDFAGRGIVKDATGKNR
ncbi:MAG: MlaA family lipoprotein, partial [Victivallales bacterium]